MDRQPRTYTPIGWNTDGELVDMTNKCKECGRLLPLPKYNKKHCPECGTYVGDATVRLDSVTAQLHKICKKCNYENEREANYCIECGTKL